MSILPGRCILCGRQTRQHCRYCHEPICSQCGVSQKGKLYCRTQHADNDHPVGRLRQLLPQHDQATRRGGNF